MTQIFDVDFATGYTDGDLNGQNSWNAQGPWDIAGGEAEHTGTFSRARLTGTTGFRAEIGDVISITLSGLSLAGDGNYAFGAAPTPEHSGAQTPAIREELGLSGMALTFGGASVATYMAGDDFDLTLELTRTGADTWTGATSITYSGSTTSGAAAPTNLAGSNGASMGLTAGAWMDADPANDLFFGMRGTSNPNGVLNIDGVALEVSAVPEPSSIALFLLGAGFAGTRRRR